MDGYPHLTFRKTWEISQDCAYRLGECDAFVKALSDIPLKPEYRDKLLQVSLIKGAQATTAIEGNTLSEEEIARIQEGWRLPPSKEYLEIEVKNIIAAFSTLLKEIVVQDNSRPITPELIREFHQMIGRDLGAHFDAIPGQFRVDNRVVGPYLAPDYQQVPELVDKLCTWLRQEFHNHVGQDFATAVLQAIVTHVYIEWIHPFGDGNGRTGRLLEFYILLRTGLPNIVSHILSNYYNQTRPEYYRQLDNARKNRNLSEFINYAVLGFRDGLRENLAVIQQNQFAIFWHNYIFETFSDYKYTKKEAFKRKRALVLQMPLEREFGVDDLLILSPDLARRYANTNRATILRDLKELQDLRLLLKVGNRYRANSGILKAKLPGKKG